MQTQSAPRLGKADAGRNLFCRSAGGGREVKGMRAERSNEGEKGSQAAERFAELLARAAVKRRDAGPQEQAEGEGDGA